MPGKTLAVLALTGLALQAHAQEFETDDDPGIRIAPAKTLSFFGEAHADAWFNADNNGRGGGEVGTYSATTKVTMLVPIDDQTDTIFSIGQTSTGYNFTGFGGFGGGRTDPIDFALKTEITGRIIHALDENWSFFGGAQAAFTGEPGADFDDALTFGGLGGVRYQVHEDLTIGVAIAVKTRLEDDALVFPVPVVEWQIDDYWHLHLGGDTSSGDPGAELTYELNDEWDLGVSVTVRSESYRLEDDNSDLPDGVFEDVAVPVMFIASWSDSPRFNITGRIGTVWYRELELRDTNGVQRGEAQLNPNFAVGISGEYRF